MTHSRDPKGRPANKSGKTRLPDRAVGLLVAEAIALAIAIVTPATPTKTGSTWNPAELFSPDPTYVEEVVASFVLVNLLLLLIGLAALVVSRYGGSE